MNHPTGSENNHTSSSNHNWERDTLREVLLEAYKERRLSRIWTIVWRGIGLIIFLSIVVGILSQKNHQNESTINQPHTAIINLTGVIGGDEYTDHVSILRDGMQAAYDNQYTKAILIRANSPGGSPVVSNTAFEEVRRLKAEHKDIPVYVIAEDLCASGCYYIAAAADKIYADPSSIVGSIGVIGSSFDATGLMDKIGIKRRTRTAGSNKGMGDPFSPETPEQQAIWQNMLNQIHTEFIKAVRTGRGKKLKEKENPDLFSGRVYTGLEAKKVGLIDDFGNIYSVSRDIVKAPELVDYTPEQDELTSLLRRRFKAQAEAQVSEWLNNIW